MSTGEQQDEVDKHIPAEIQASYLANAMGPGQGDIACKNLTLAFWDFRKPSICAVNGLAVGGGANLALANFHDCVICSQDAKFLWPFTKLNITPELGSTYVMPLVMGFCRAKTVLLSNQWVSAKEAHELGLCNKVVPGKELLPTALAIAKTWASSNLTAMCMSKQLLNSTHRAKLSEVMDAENEAIMISLRSDETKQRVKAMAAASAAKKKQQAEKARL